jgi:hypothetical protein
VVGTYFPFSNQITRLAGRLLNQETLLFIIASGGGNIGGGVKAYRESAIPNPDKPEPNSKGKIYSQNLKVGAKIISFELRMTPIISLPFHNMILDLRDSILNCSPPDVNNECKF